MSAKDLIARNHAAFVVAHTHQPEVERPLFRWSAEAATAQASLLQAQSGCARSSDTCSAFVRRISAAGGFSLWATRSILSGQGGEILQVAKANLHDLASE
jgi:hypothetical protein